MFKIIAHPGRKVKDLPPVWWTGGGFNVFLLKEFLVDVVRLIAAKLVLTNAANGLY